MSATEREAPATPEGPRPRNSLLEALHENVYRWIAAIAGGIAGAVSLIGFLRPYILYRRRFPAAQWSTRGAPYRR